MLTLLLVLSLVGYSCQLCCGPKQWEGMEYVTLTSTMVGVSQPNIVNSIYRVSVDAVSKMVSAKGETYVNGVRSVVNNVRDYTNNVQYTVSGGKCSRARLTPNANLNCVPVNSTYVGKSSFGAGANSLSLDNYQLNMEGYDISLTLSPGCIPVGERFFKNDRTSEYVMGTTGFSGISVGIEDMSVFSIPPECAALAASGPLPDAGVFGKRHVML